MEHEVNVSQRYDTPVRMTYHLSGIFAIRRSNSRIYNNIPAGANTFLQREILSLRVGLRLARVIVNTELMTIKC